MTGGKKMFPEQLTLDLQTFQVIVIASKKANMPMQYKKHLPGFTCKCM